MSIYDLAEQANLNLATIIDIECEDNHHKVTDNSLPTIHCQLTP
jgi:hypothetical protein